MLITQLNVFLIIFSLIVQLAMIFTNPSSILFFIKLTMNFLKFQIILIVCRSFAKKRIYSINNKHLSLKPKISLVEYPYQCGLPQAVSKTFCCHNFCHSCSSFFSLFTHCSPSYVTD